MSVIIGTKNIIIIITIIGIKNIIIIDIKIKNYFDIKNVKIISRLWLCQ